MKRTQTSENQLVTIVANAVALAAIFVGLALIRLASTQQTDSAFPPLFAGILFLALAGFLFTMGGAR